MSIRRDIRGGCSLGEGEARSRHLFEFVSFLLLLEESLLRSVEVYSNMITVQLDDVYRTLVSADILTIIVSAEIFTIIVGQEYLGDVVN